MNKYKSKIEEVMSSRQVHLLYKRLEDEEVPFALKAKRASDGIWKITLRTHLFNKKHFCQLFKSLKRAW